jgi:hypothetical protein
MRWIATLMMDGNDDGRVLGDPKVDRVRKPRIKHCRNSP